MNKISSYVIVAVLAVLALAGCSSNKDAAATKFIPEEASVVVSTNPDHFLSQSKIAQETDLLRAIEVPADVLNNMPEYGINPQEDLYVFLIDHHTFGLSTKLADTQKFLDGISKSMEIDKDKKTCYQDGFGFKVFGDILVGAFDEDADPETIRRVIRDLDNGKGKNDVNDNTFFKEMISKPSVVSIWMKPKSAFSTMRRAGLIEMNELTKMSLRYMNEDGAMYVRLQSENGKLSVVSAGDYLDEDYIEEMDVYQGKHLKYIPKDADFVLGCNLNGDFITEVIESTKAAGHLDKLKMFGIDFWELIGTVDGDFTMSLNSIKMQDLNMNKMPEVDATLMLDVDDDELVGEFLLGLNGKLTPMSQRVEKNTYKVFMEEMGQLNYGIQNHTLYFNLSGDQFAKAKKAYSFDQLGNKTLAVMSIRMDNIDEATVRLLEKAAGMDLDFLQGVDMHTELDGNVIRQDFSILLKEEINPLQLLVQIFKTNL